MARIRPGLRAALAVTAVIALTTALAQSSSQASPSGPDGTDDHGRPIYLNPTLPTQYRVNDLLRRMTLAEKVGQMTQIKVGELRGDCNGANGALVASCEQKVLVDAHVGSILSGGGDYPVDNTAKGWAQTTNGIQHYALDNNRLKIPVLYGADGVHGDNNLVTATMFPQQIGVGATWDPALAEKMGESTSSTMRATGVFWNFAPVSDLSRDTRWGRYYETLSEDPTLAGSLSAALVTGMQAYDGKGATAKLTATAKHFAGYSEPINGHDRVPAQIPVRELQDVFLPAFQPQIDAGAKTAMANSGAVNGIPVHASKFMLTTELRQRLGFDGVTVSDWADMASLATKYHVAADYPTAIAMSVNAGVDMAMEPADAASYTKALIDDVHNGLISQQRIDQAVGRILKLKFDLGLFEKPFVDENTADGIVNGAGLDLARQAATESTVLLRNDNKTLPLSTGVHKIVVAGDSADNPSQQFGGWTVNWQGVDPKGPTPPVVTPVQGIKEAVPNANVVAATDQASAVAQAADADAVVVVLGEKAGAEGNNDKEDPSLTAAQQSLVDSLKATGKPVVVVLMTGRPLVLGSVAGAPTLLADWLPGSEGGHALADILFGKANPSGRLSVSWPKTVGDEPMSYDQLPGTNGGASSGYDPLFPFGYGLSYTSFATSAPTLSAPTVRADGKETVSVTVTNTGAVAGSDVVPVYVHQPVSPVLVPDKRLVGFTRVDLKPGESKTVQVSFDVSKLAVTVGDVDATGKREVEKSAYSVVVGSAQAPFTVR
ncbi:glycoside hydrolase family 3 N-terminal domain-containing protein [Kutzneria sp. CA-103260]|uniref:glycoside hydrolase family 3 N-terminal domain-containing protein n=1 Tax=Kutzneria sp. CA-103260 TaxID=2802641 RepID=UPI001BAAD344|nr:glycoside hydrolase family 3 N-terminal domain-containing protein [Kutzneria sp. CA-103260]QUQ68040.1 Beta-glucosidase BoGH3B [Kutzneria sp. CA-103260]